MNTAKASVTAPQRDARGRWIKGVSGSDLGRPRSALAELCRAQIDKHSLVAVLGSIAARKGEYNKRAKIPVTVADQSYGPALRAARLEPMNALRKE